MIENLLGLRYQAIEISTKYILFKSRNNKCNGKSLITLINYQPGIISASPIVSAEKGYLYSPFRLCSFLFYILTIFGKLAARTGTPKRTKDFTDALSLSLSLSAFQVGL